MSASSPQFAAEPQWRLFTIPAFPTVATKALRLLGSEDTRLLELYRVIESDPAFASEVLRIANSPLYAQATPVKSLIQAAMLLGFDRLRGAAVTIGIRSYLGRLLTIPSLEACWRHSLACAMIGERLAQSTQMRADDVYTAGIMHDIGRFALAAVHPKNYADFLAQAVIDPSASLLEEARLFGTDHCELGRVLVEQWELPNELIEITSHHHDLDRTFTSDVPSLIRCACRLADAIGFHAHHPAHPCTYDEVIAEIPEDIRAAFEFDPSQMAYAIEAKIRSLT